MPITVKRETELEGHSGGCRSYQRWLQLKQTVPITVKRESETGVPEWRLSKLSTMASISRRCPSQSNVGVPEWRLSKLSTMASIKADGAHHSQTGYRNPLEYQSGGCRSYQRWLQLKQTVPITVKRDTETRWSARVEVVEAINDGFN